MASQAGVEEFVRGQVFVPDNEEVCEDFLDPEPVAVIAGECSIKGPGNGVAGIFKRSFDQFGQRLATLDLHAFCFRLFLFLGHTSSLQA